MSKVVTIPDYTRPNWVCCINGVRYAYPAGSTQEVPDEVADLIEDQMEQVPVPEPVQPEGGGVSWEDLPDNVASKEYVDKAIEKAVRELKGLVEYGVEWDYSQPAATLTRTLDAAEFGNPVPATALDAVGSSPFDKIMPWAGMKRYNIIDGEVAYSEDDDGFSMTDYDTVVYIPPFYYKAAKD